MQGVLIAGDVYDRPVPPSGAVRILDDLLDQFADRNVPVFFISGNHDSRERLAFGAALFEKSGVYMAGEELCKKIRWKDEYGELNIWLMPFLKPAEVRMVYSEKEISTYTDAVRAVLEGMEIDPDVRNILVGPSVCGGAGPVRVGGRFPSGDSTRWMSPFWRDLIMWRWGISTGRSL